jgi:hypothetical protein
VDPQHPGLVAPLNGPLALFGVGEIPKNVQRADLLRVERISNGSSTWQAKTESGIVTLKPFASIQNEAYRLYHQVES